MALAIDGTTTGQGTGVTSMAASLTTTTAADIVVVAIFTESTGGTATTVLSVGDTVNTYARRNAVADTTSHTNMEIWWAYWPASGTNTITVQLTGTALDDGSFIAFGVKGFLGSAYHTNPWDQTAATALAFSASAVASSAITTAVNAVTTANANAMVINIGGSADPGGGGVFTSGTIGGVTQTPITNVNNTGGSNSAGIGGGFINYTSTQSGLTAAWALTLAKWIIMPDALAQGVAAVAAVGVLIAHR